jgi:hypothetical protein
MRYPVVGPLDVGGDDVVDLADAICVSSWAGVVPPVTTRRGSRKRSSWGLAHAGLNVVAPT